MDPMQQNQYPQASMPQYPQYPQTPMPSPMGMSENKSKKIFLIVTISLSVLLLAALIFGFWAFSSRQDYKENVSSKVDVAVKKAEVEIKAKEQAIFDQKAKEPYVNYRSNETYGGLDITYPKNWSLYVDANGTDSNGLDWFFNPVAVAPAKSQSSVFALRARVSNRSYDNVVKSYQNNKKVSISAYRLPRLNDIVGVRVEGQLTNYVRGSMVILPLRDKTIQLWTESSKFIDDFNNIILKNATFVP